MAKAKLKPKVLVEEVAIPEGMTARDLSLEKRVQLYNQSFEKFKRDSAETFGLGLAMEIAYLPQATVPRQVLVDLLKKEDGKNNPAQGTQG